MIFDSIVQYCQKNTWQTISNNKLLLNIRITVLCSAQPLASFWDSFMNIPLVSGCFSFFNTLLLLFTCACPRCRCIAEFFWNRCQLRVMKGSDICQAARLYFQRGCSPTTVRLHILIDIAFTCKTHNTMDCVFLWGGNSFVCCIVSSPLIGLVVSLLDKFVWCVSIITLCKSHRWRQCGVIDW